MRKSTLKGRHSQSDILGSSGITQRLVRNASPQAPVQNC